METAKGMFIRKYAGVPAWIILLIAVGGVYLYMRHTGSSLFGNSGSDTTGGDGSPASVEGQNPEIVFVPASGDSATNPQHPSHPAGPPATHTISTRQRAEAIMADFRKHGMTYFHNHPNALAWLKVNAPKDYKVVTSGGKTTKTQSGRVKLNTISAKGTSIPVSQRPLPRTKVKG